MSKVLKITIGLSITFLILLITLFFFLRYQIVKSFPQYSGVIKLEHLNDEVKIYRDDFGVPSIYSENEDDIWFAVGFVQAQDRLWQMDLYRRTTQGKLSEIFGKDALEYDILFRTLDIPNVAEKILYQLPDNVKNAIQSYSEGVNAYIKLSKGKYPVEFDILNYEPEEWKPEHCLLVSRLMAWYLNFSWWTELVHWKIAEKLGAQKAQEIFAEYPKDAPVISNLSISQVPKSISSFINIMKSFKNDFGIDGSGFGSNCWVVDGNKSISGKPIIANDPHLTLPTPSHWYEMNLFTKNFNVGGFSFPGTPFIIIGHNENIAWGLTNAMIDDADFFVTRIDSSDSSKYIYNKKSYPINIKEDIIKVGKDDSVVVQIRSTHLGPVINYIHPSVVSKSESFDSLLVSMKWVGFEPTLETYTFYLLNKAKNSADFVNALSYFGVPGQNFIYADNEGNIGYSLAAKIPIRKNFNPILPVFTSDQNYDWQGFVRFEDLPKILNPKEHFIASANNKIINYSNYYITNLYMPRYRIERILQLLNSEDKFSANDFKNFQNDLFSLHAQKYNEIILEILADSLNDQKINFVLEYLKNWDFNNTVYDAATSIFNMFFVKLLQNTFQDELGEELFNEYIYFPAFAINALDQMIEGESNWFDNVYTDTTENKRMIVKKSFMDAIEELRLKYGPDIKNWQWGNLHQLTLKHPLGQNQTLSYVFNLGPYKIGGSSTTINNSEINFTKPFDALVGPSMRYIFDLSDVNKRYSVIAGGQSGQALHKHYDDQISLWLNGQYKEVTFNSFPREDYEGEKLILISKRK